ncbi:JAB domain-containing protein [Dethiosulfovibrio salsuginis]|uniref:DNA repair protein RadC n=1 Tax=Dethiosulfovibrio salsuginis TaxID=561720 RepID=A0A1X7JBK5_9BACT|nr:DNA repair protein RadC [Dethiosulfovibrio salsuginis]SMG24444.1 DNA repair protein RadC [Dethiosulfovibrio salsuginis]
MTGDQLPRERLLLKGPSALSDGELLAVLLRTGDGSRDVVGLSSYILSSFGGLRGLSKSSVQELMSLKGLGVAKSTAILAAIELGRRISLLALNESGDRTKISVALDEIRLFISEEDREFIIALFLDEKEGIIAREKLSYGGPDGASLDLRYLLKKAVRLDSKGLVLVHNHPNGTLDSSYEDKVLTKIVKEKTDALGLDFLGHYIVSRQGIAAVSL